MKTEKNNHIDLIAEIKKNIITIEQTMANLSTELIILSRKIDLLEELMQKEEEK